MANEVQKTGQQGGNVATQQDTSIKGWLQSETFIATIKNVLPSHLTPERMSRVACTALMRTPKLSKCTQASFFKCMLDLSQWGLEPDGRRAHLIPFENRKAQTIECTLIIDYKGLAELVYRSGVVSFLHADVVREGDFFVYSMGELSQHIPWFLRRDPNKPAEAGKIYAVYCKAMMKDGSAKTEVLSVDEVYSIRDNSQGWRAFKKYGGQSPWNPENPVSEQEMMKKTAFRRLSKWLPLSAEIRDAVEHDDDAIDVEATVPQSRARVSDLNLQLTDDGAAGDQDEHVDHDEQGDQHGQAEGHEQGQKLTAEQITEQWCERVSKAKKRSELVDLNAELINGETRITNDQKMPIVDMISKKLSTMKAKAPQGDLLDQQ